MARKQTRIEITLDQFFKQSSRRYFTARNCEVKTEAELYTGPKRVDLIVIKRDKKANWKDFGLFDYFLEHNLISYKSFKDKITLKDLYDCFIYYYAYLEECREAMLTNTTITLLVSRIPKSFLLQYSSALQEIAKGIFEIRNTIIHLRIINIEKAELRGEDGAFLSVFYKDKARIVKERKQYKGKPKGS